MWPEHRRWFCPRSAEVRRCALARRHPRNIHYRPTMTTTASPVTPDFRSQDFLRDHIRRTMAFYHPRCIDPAGGFFHYFKDDGSVYDASHRHLVSSTRFVFNYAMAASEFADDPALRNEYLQAARHGLAYLREKHYDPVRSEEHTSELQSR